MAWFARTGRWHGPGGWRELLRLAVPFVLSNSFLTLQIFIDRVFLSQLGSDAVGAAMAAVLLFWTPSILLQSIAGYATTFVAQYTGAGRPERVGAAVWQALYFSVLSGVGFLGLVPLTESLVAIGSHSRSLQALEATYFRCLCYTALPVFVTAAASSFFAGRGKSWTVLLINAAGLATNGVLAYAWIFGKWGLPAWGMAGVGWAAVVGSYVSAILAVCLMLRRRHREEFGTHSAWRFDRELFWRLMRFGVPTGLLSGLDCLAFTVFTFLVGRLGEAELAATSIAFTLNIVAIVPMVGIAQGVAVLVGQRLGEDCPDLAARSTWSGFQLAWLYMAFFAALFIFCPHIFLFIFQSNERDELRGQVAAFVPVLLRFVAVYSLFDSMNLVFSFALKGAGDTRFVTIVSVLLSWPLMVLPTWGAYHFHWGLYWSWGFASAYIIALAFVFLARFRCGKWKSMRVIEAAPVGVAEEVVAESVADHFPGANGTSARAHDVVRQSPP